MQVDSLSKKQDKTQVEKPFKLSIKNIPNLLLSLLGFPFAVIATTLFFHMISFIVGLQLLLLPLYLILESLGVPAFEKAPSGATIISWKMNFYSAIIVCTLHYIFVILQDTFGIIQDNE